MPADTQISLVSCRLLIALAVCALAATAGAAIGSAAGGSTAGGVFAQPPETEPDDRLPRETERLIEELTRRGMPELIEPLVAKAPLMHRVHVARAHLRAALGAPDAAGRERSLASAAATYRTVVALQNDGDWLVGERRRLRVASWWVEFGDLILRYWIAPDLDRYEITSGLDYDRPRLESRLREAMRCHERAAILLRDLREGVRAEEDRYLLLGIADRIVATHQQSEINQAWAGLCLAVIGELEDSARAEMLETALHTFDARARNEGAPGRKYSALLGAGIALRGLGRHEEAAAAFDRVRNSTAPAGLTARARLEKARLLLDLKRFDAARKELSALAALPERGPVNETSESAFYVRLAPVIHAYSFDREAAAVESADLRAAARGNALREFTALAERGGIWSDIVNVYLDALAGGKRDLQELTTVELRNAARRHMTNKRHAAAISVLQIMLARGDPASVAQHPEARFNLGVCHFQAGHLRQAADQFLQQASAPGPAESDLPRKAAEYAYRCWRQIALETKQPADCRKLTEAATALAEGFPDHGLAFEALWVAAVALEEAADHEGAKAAYAKVPRSSENYWAARRGVARCGQRFMEHSAADTDPEARRRTARAVAASWQSLADELAAADGPAGLDPEDRDLWIQHARLSSSAVLASGVLGEHRRALEILSGLPDTSRVLALRIRCHRGLGELKKANAVLSEYLEQTPGAEAGGVLLGMAADLEAAVARLRSAGRGTEAAERAAETVDIVRQLLTWIESQPRYRQHVSAVRFALAKALVQAGRRDEAVDLLDRMIADAPDNGDYVRHAARLHEKAMQAGSKPQRNVASERAEALWAKLLSDKGLRDRSPEVYWEARYHWLRHQLRRGRAPDVVKGIETERVWYPDLGGPPWQGRLLSLAREAEAGIEGSGP